MLVSVMMPAWNVESYIAEAIESMLDQTYRNWQLVIFDDGSTDGTIAAITPYLGDERIELYSDSEHHSCPYARNKCLEYMRGDVFARQDADDISDRTRIEKSLDALESYDIISTRYSWLLADGSTRPMSHIGEMNPTRYRIDGSHGPCCPSIVCRRDVYDVVGRFDELILAGSDGDWNLRAIDRNLTWGLVDEYLYFQRRHPNQISQRLRNQQQSVHGIKSIS